ncbi:MAG: DedA family protein [Candidatus Pacebacteria bacterium]|jgi:membrane protein DedA with SNARE-associated domain|nr:DedA family protein [Candidatus Paceibacterota bacterium]
MLTVTTLAQFAYEYVALVYVLLFLAIVIEGELAMIIAGILAQIGVLDLVMVLSVAYAGAVGKTVLWYYLGMLLKKIKYAQKFFSYLEKRVLYLFPRLREHPFWSIFFSKFIYGINHFTLVLSGFMRLDFKTYLKAELSSSVLWVLGMLSLGYFASTAAIGYSKEFHKFSLIILLFILAFILVEKSIAFFVEIARDAKENQK